jgi:hypothetical protein
LKSHKIYQLENAKYLLKSKNKFTQTTSKIYTKEIVKKYNVRLLLIVDNIIFMNDSTSIKNFFKSPLKYDGELLKAFHEDLAEELL